MLKILIPSACPDFARRSARRRRPAIAADAEDLTQIYQLARQADPTLPAPKRTRARPRGRAAGALALLPQINGSYGYKRDDTGFNSVGVQQNSQAGTTSDP